MAYDLLMSAIFSGLEGLVTQISRLRQYLTLNVYVSNGTR